MNTSSRKRVAMAFPYGLQNMERAIRGITDYARPHLQWSFCKVPETFGTTLEWLRYWRGDGAFVAINTPEDLWQAQQIRIPIVNLATYLPGLEAPSITMDHGRIGELAAQHLIERNFRRFGYYGASDLLYAQLRRDGFCAAVQHVGGDVKILEVRTFNRRARQKLADQQRTLEHWLRNLEPPVGIFASSD